MNCPICKTELKQTPVRVWGAKKRVLSYQCPNCDYFSFDEKSTKTIVKELRSPLKVRQKVVKLSADRLGIYFSGDVVRSLKLKKGEYLYLSAPDEKHIVLERN